MLAETGVGCTYNLKGMSNNADSHELLPVISTIHHQGISKTLNDGALSLAESLHCISASRMGDVDGCADLDVIAVLRDPRLAVNSHVSNSAPPDRQAPR